MKKWTKEGFEAFRNGTFGNGGQNIYVSKNGVLQRIFNMDIDGNGHPDIPFANSHRAGERQAIKVFTDYPSFDKFDLLATNGPADGFVCEANDDGTYGIITDPAYGKVAKIGDTEYTTLDAAITASQAATCDVTIKLLADGVITVN